jgi:two-component system sensor histidine kinase RegB
MLERLGTPYQSSKGTPGRGLGLFLVGQRRAHAGRTDRGAQSSRGGARCDHLPLAALMLEEQEG